MTTQLEAPSLKRSYPREVRLPNGKTLTLRLMGRGDIDRVLAFARALPKKDLLFLQREPVDGEEGFDPDRARRGFVSAQIDIAGHGVLETAAVAAEEATRR